MLYLRKLVVQVPLATLYMGQKTRWCCVSHIRLTTWHRVSHNSAIWDESQRGHMQGESQKVAQGES